MSTFLPGIAKKAQAQPEHRFGNLRELNAKLRGYPGLTARTGYNYYGVVGNYASLKQFFDQAIRILYKWLNRRGQRRSRNWPISGNCWNTSRWNGRAP